MKKMKIMKKERKPEISLMHAPRSATMLPIPSYTLRMVRTFIEEEARRMRFTRSNGLST